MLSKEEIEIFRNELLPVLQHLHPAYEKANAICDLALLGLSVQEGVKDAREVAESIAYDCMDAQQYENSHISMMSVNIDKASELIAAFALKQGGEVIAEFDSEVIPLDGTDAGVLHGCPPLPLKVGQRVHVSITALEERSNEV